MSQEINIIIMGKTGSGKSTIVNAIMEKEVAPTGKGQPITKENKIYSINKSFAELSGDISQNNNIKINLFDTVGLEISNEITQKTVYNINESIKSCKSIENNENHSIVWFCVSQSSHRFEPFEVNLLRQLSLDNEIPFVIVITECYNDESGELEDAIRDCISGVTICRTLAKPFSMRNGTIPAFGINELLNISILKNNTLKCHLLEEKLEILNCNIAESQRQFELLKRKIQYRINKYSQLTLNNCQYGPVSLLKVDKYCNSMIEAINDVAEIKPTNSINTLFLNGINRALLTYEMVPGIIGAKAAQHYIETVGERYKKSIISLYKNINAMELYDNELVTQRLEEEIKMYK